MGKGRGDRELLRTRTYEKTDRPKRPSSSGIKFARELFEKHDGTFLRTLRTRLLVDMDNFTKTGKVSTNTVTYHIIYENGVEAIVRYKNGKEIVTNPNEPNKRYKGFRLNHIAYISRADGNQNFSDSLGFFSSSQDKRIKSIFSSDSRFKSYNNEVSKLFKPKRKKSTSKKSSTKKSSTKKSTGTKINKPVTKPKVWERGKKTVVSKKKK